MAQMLYEENDIAAIADMTGLTEAEITAMKK